MIITSAFVVLFTFISGYVQAQESGLDIAKQYGENLSLFAKTGRGVYQMNIKENLCSSGVRVSNQLIMKLGNNEGIKAANGNYLLSTFLSMIHEAGFEIELSDYQLVSKKTDMKGDKVEKVSCTMKVYCMNVSHKKDLAFKAKDLIVIRNGKITLITKL